MCCRSAVSMLATNASTFAQAASWDAPLMLGGEFCEWLEGVARTDCYGMRGSFVSVPRRTQNTSTEHTMRYAYASHPVDHLTRWSTSALKTLHSVRQLSCVFYGYR